MAAMTVAGVFCAPSNGDFFCSAADEERGDENMPVEMNGVAPSYSAHILDIEPLEGGVFRIVVPPGAQPGEAIRVQSPNGGPMLNVVLPRDHTRSHCTHCCRLPAALAEARSPCR